MPAVYDDHAESAFWNAPLSVVRPSVATESGQRSTDEEELVVRPEVVSLQRWLDLNA